MLAKIESAEDSDELIKLEKEINSMVKEKRIKVYHGLVLRNAIEEMESSFGGENNSREEE